MMHTQSVPNIIKREAFIIRPKFSGGLKEKRIFGEETLKMGPEQQNQHLEDLQEELLFYPELYRLTQNADVK